MTPADGAVKHDLSGGNRSVKTERSPPRSTPIKSQGRTRSSLKSSKSKMKAPESDLEDSDQESSDHDLKLTDRKIKLVIDHAERHKGSDRSIGLEIDQ